MSILNIGYLGRHDTTVTTAETIGEATVLTLDGDSGDRLRLTLDRKLAEQIHLVLGRELMVQDREALEARDDLRAVMFVKPA